MPQETLFGTSGIRGPADTFFTKRFCYDIAKTFVEFLKEENLLGPIAIGMDPRTSSPRIKKDLLLGLSLANEELYDEGATPIPSMNWLLKVTPVKAAIMITGSHIAPELNGVKFYAHEEEVSAEDQKKIEQIYFRVKGSKIPENINPEVIIEDRARTLYTEMLLSLAKKPYPKWKVAIDCANGSQSVVMPELLRILGLEVVEVNCDPQKDFIARDTDTDDKAGIEEVKKEVVTKNCDFGIAFDGDGDRVVFISEKGEFIQGEYSCGLVAKESPGKTIVTTVAASQVVEKLGKKVVRTKVGSPYVVGKMKEIGAKFGFEQNGGAISAEIMYSRDGGGMTMKLLNIYSKFKGPLSALVATLPKFYMFRTKVDYKKELKETIISDAKKHFRGVSVDETDGLKIRLDETTWILFRSSANAPEFRVFAESQEEERAKKLLDESINFVKEVISKHG